MKKATAPKLQEDIQTEEDLSIFLDKSGLLVLDIYSEWCGPCLGMVTVLRKLKLDVGGDNLHFAICKADTIETFKRFRHKSEPTWLLVTNRKAVNIMFGSEVPKLLDRIYSELRLLLSPKIRNVYELNEFQPVEVKRWQIKEDAKNKALALELEQKERERLNYLTEVTDIIMDNLNDMGVTIFGPQIQRDSIKKIIQKAEQLKIQIKDRKTVAIFREDFNTIHFNCPNPITDDVLEQLEGKELLVGFWKVLGSGPKVPEILRNFAEVLQAPQMQSGEEEEFYEDIPAIIAPIEVEVAEENINDDIISNKSKEELISPQKSLDLYFGFEENAEDEEGEGDEWGVEGNENIQFLDGAATDISLDKDKQLFEENQLFDDKPRRKKKCKKILIPPIWVPNNQRTHAALIYTYFRKQTTSFLPPDPVPEPPYIIMAFDVYKKKDLIPHAERYKDDVPMYGFFTSDDADDAKYIASSMNKYRTVTTNDKIVLKVQKATSRTMLTLVTYGPSYVSPSSLVGQDDVSKFFPPTYKTAGQEAQEEADVLQEQAETKSFSKKKKQTLPKPHKMEMPEKTSDNVLAGSAQNIETVNLTEPLSDNNTNPVEAA